INPFWFFFLAWYIALSFVFIFVQLWKWMMKRAIEKKGVIVSSNEDANTVITYFSDGQLTAGSEPQSPPPNVTHNSTFRLEMEKTRESEVEMKRLLCLEIDRRK
ncbi:hypothetical protein PFISCL1PPCAC_4119, partial [Pristionchus fissidentatus]